MIIYLMNTSFGTLYLNLYKCKFLIIYHLYIYIYFYFYFYIIFNKHFIFNYIIKDINYKKGRNFDNK